MNPVLDEGVLRELQEIMEDDYLSLLRTYLRNAPKLLADGHAAIDRGSVEALVNPVHSLRSSSANVGAMQLSELAREAERLARGGSLADASAAFRAVEAAYQVAEQALREPSPTPRLPDAGQRLVSYSAPRRNRPDASAHRATA